MGRMTSAIVMPLLFVLAAAQATQPPEDPPARRNLLIQSELTLLSEAGERITLRVTDASPEHTLKQVRKAVKFEIDVEGELPRTPKLTASFEDTPAKEVLTWFAKEVDVVYRAEEGRRLVVYPRQPV